MILPTLESMGFELVQVRLVGGRQRTLQVMAEPLERDRAMTVDDCAAISESVSAILDVHDPVAGAFTLEVSTPGIDRPLVKRADFERFVGFEIKLESELPIEGRKRLQGRLLGMVGDKVALDVAGREVEVPFEAARKAKLVLNDELLARGQPKKRRGSGKQGE